MPCKIPFLWYGHACDFLLNNRLWQKWWECMWSGLARFQTLSYKRQYSADVKGAGILGKSSWQGNGSGFHCKSLRDGESPIAGKNLYVAENWSSLQLRLQPWLKLLLQSDDVTKKRNQVVIYHTLDSWNTCCLWWCHTVETFSSYVTISDYQGKYVFINIC